jgi:hypothetical protein
MNSFQDLNAYSAASTIEFTDNRPSNVLFDLSTVPTPTPVNIFEGENHNVPYTVNITDIINYQACTIIYKVDVSGFPAGTTVEWPSYPAYMTATNAAGVYSITGFKTPTDWLTVRSPVVNIPDDIAGTYVYPVSIVYFFGTVETTKSWNVTVNITAVDEMSASTVFDFFASTTSTITGTPLIIDADVAKTYTLTITPSVTGSVTTLSSSGTGGTSTFNGTTKVLTLVGTKTQVNSHLAAISFASSSSTNDLTLTYLLTNNLNAVTDTKYQTLRCLDLLYLGNTRVSSIYYNEDTIKNVQGGPLITDSAYDGSGTYTMTVTPSTTAAVSTMSTTGYLSPQTITNTGGVKVKTAQSKFGGASAYFPGLANDSFTVSSSSAFNFSNNDFTVEFWIYPAYGFPSGGIMNKVGSSVWGPHLGWSIVLQDYKVEFWYGFTTPVNYSPLSAVSKAGQSSTLSSNSWSHIAFVCQNGVLKTFTNGVLTQTASTIEIAASDSLLQIGKGYYGNDGTGQNAGSWRDTWKWVSDPTQYTNGMLNGYLDEIRISKIARYTSTFTPATSAFTADAYQSLLIHANGANDSTTFTDDTAGLVLSGSTSFNSSTKVLTLSGTREAVNVLLDYIFLTPAADYRQNFTLSYKVTTPRSSTATKTQQMLIGSSDTDVTNINITRSYVANNPNYIFATNTPAIADTDASNPTYTVSVSCSVGLGSFATNRNVSLPATRTLSFTGTKAECNAWFATVIFYPNAGVTATGNITYTQSKNGTQQTSQQFSIIGSSGSYPDEGFLAGPTTVGAWSWTPTNEQVYYVGVIQILIVGGGGGGGFAGGGGGRVRLINNAPLTAGVAITGTVGVGGTAGYFSSQNNNYVAGSVGGTSTVNRGTTWSYSSQGGYPGSVFYVNNANGVMGGGNGIGTSGATTSGAAGSGSDYTQYRGGAGGGAGGSATYNGASTPSTPGPGVTFEDITYGVGGGGASFLPPSQSHTKGTTSGTAGGGGGGGIGGTYKITGRPQIYNLPLADNGQNGRVKIWVRRV